MAAPIIAGAVYTLAGVFVRASTKAMARRLSNAKFRLATSGQASSKANIITANKDNIISLITRGLKGARTTTKDKITKSPTGGKPRTAQEVRDALKRNAEKPKPKSGKGAVLGTAVTLAATPTRLGDSTVKTRREDIREAEKREVKKANELAKKTTATAGDLKTRKGKTAKEIREIAEKALRSVDVEDAALLRMEQKYVPKDVNKLMSSLRPKARPETKKKTLSAFGSAFSNARKAKKYSFKFKGKEYTTRLKEETVAEHKKKFLKKKD